MSETENQEVVLDDATLHEYFFIHALEGITTGALGTSASDDSILQQAWDFASRLEEAFKGAKLWAESPNSLHHEAAARLLRSLSTGAHSVEFAAWERIPRRAFELASRAAAMMDKAAGGAGIVVRYPDGAVAAPPPPPAPANALPPLAAPPTHVTPHLTTPLAGGAQVRVGFGGVQTHAINQHAPVPHATVITPLAAPAPAAPLPPGGVTHTVQMGAMQAKVTIAPLDPDTQVAAPEDWVDQQNPESNKVAAFWRKYIPDLPARVEPAKDMNGRGATLRSHLIDMFKAENPAWEAQYTQELGHGP
jgi:hypothetical protein